MYFARVYARPIVCGKKVTKRFTQTPIFNILSITKTLYYQKFSHYDPLTSPLYAGLLIRLLNQPPRSSP